MDKGCKKEGNQNKDSRKKESIPQNFRQGQTLPAIAAVIMECNPFHAGHQAILKAAREQTKAEYVIVVMSGDFVQRGAPAILPKEQRVKEILLHGADMVLELPVVYALGAADWFARGSVALLSRLGIVTDLVFGSESADLTGMQAIASVLADEPQEYRTRLRKGLASGLSFPAAQSEALKHVCGYTMPTDPNDILGIEYIKALAMPAVSLLSPSRQSTLRKKAETPVVAAATRNLRENSYGIKTIPEAETPAPAAAPRNLRENSSGIKAMPEAETPVVAAATRNFRENSSGIKAMPEAETPVVAAASRNLREKPSGVKTIPQAQAPTITAAPRILPHPIRRVSADNASALRKEMYARDPGLATSDDFSSALLYSLWKESAFHEDSNSGPSMLDPLCRYIDVTPDLARRIRSLQNTLVSFSSFTADLKSRNYTYTRISRALFHILLDLTKDDLQQYGQNGLIGYARVLGFRKEARPLLSLLAAHSQIPVLITKEDRRTLSPVFTHMLCQDAAASALYDAVLFRKQQRAPADMSTGIIPIVPEFSKPLIVV